MNVRPSLQKGLIFVILLALLISLGENMVRGRLLLQEMETIKQFHAGSSLDPGTAISSVTGEFLAQLAGLEKEKYGELIGFRNISDAGQGYHGYQYQLRYAAEQKQCSLLLTWLERNTAVKDIINFKLKQEEDQEKIGHNTILFEVDIILGR